MAFDVMIGVALVLGVMILIHEWGHFIVARLFDVRVDVFSIGFGPRLFGVKRGATDYRVSALPLGGYVRMAGQDLSEVDSNDQAPTGAPDELMSKKRWQRGLIAFAGPAVNLVFPLFLLTGFFLYKGLPHSASLLQPLQVRVLPADVNAGSAPLQPGDRIVQLNGVPNPTWEKAYDMLAVGRPNAEWKLQVENNGVRRDVSVSLKEVTDSKRLLGFAPLPPVIEEVSKDLPARKAGLKAGDRINAVNGRRIEYWGQFVDVVRESNGQPVQVEVERKAEAVKVTVTPEQGLNEAGEKVWQIGVANHDEIVYQRSSFGETTTFATRRTGDFIAQTIGVVGKLFSGRVSVKQLQGVVGIAQVSGDAVRRGPSSVILLMAFISINLGVLNLLPIPILDGGQILLLSIEGIRRRDLSLKFKERFVQVGLVFLLVLFAYVMYNDVARLFPGHS